MVQSMHCHLCVVAEHLVLVHCIHPIEHAVHGVAISLYALIIDKARAHQCLSLTLSTPPYVAPVPFNERTATVEMFFGLQMPNSIKDVCSNLYIGVRYTTWSNASGVMASTNGTLLLPDANRTWSQWFTWKAASFIGKYLAVLNLPKQIPNDMFYMFQVHIKRGEHFRRANITHTTGRLSQVVYAGNRGIA